MLKKKENLCAIFLFFIILSSLVLSIKAGAANTEKIKSVVLKINKQTVTNKTYSLKKGKKIMLKVKVTPIKSKKRIVFKSNNKKVATVSARGIITAKVVGTAKISVFVKDRYGKNKTTWLNIKVTKKHSSIKKPDTEPSESENPVQTPEPITVKDYFVEYGSNKIYGKMYTPEKNGIYPAIIMCHGYNGVGDDFVNECTYFAQNGYVAYAFDFCGGSGRSKSSGRSTDMTIFTEKENLIEVFKNIKGLNNVDPNNIFLHGGSQGGLVAALATEDLADEVKGLMLYFPAFNIPYDWTAMYPDENKIPKVIPWWGLDLGKEFAVSVHGYKTFEHIGLYSKNVLILYGEDDAIVQRSYVDKAKNIYKNCELKVYSNEGHGFTPAGVDKAKKALLDFMNKNKQ